MLNEAIIHIGMNKTGSTSIQNALRQFDDGRTFYAQLSHINHSIPVYTAFHKNYARYHIWRKKGLPLEEIDRLRRDYRADLAAQLARPDRQRVLISGEDISSLDPNGAREFIDLVRKYAKTIKIVIYVRDPVGFAASSFQQRIKDGSAEIPEVIRPGYENRIGKFVDLVGAENIIVRIFSRDLLKNGNVVDDFCDIADIDMPQANAANANESLSMECTKLVFLFNRTNPCYFGDPIVMGARQMLIAHLRNAYKDGQSMDSSLFASIADKGAADYLRDNFGLSFEDKKASENDASTDLEAWMADMSDVSDAPLKAIMKRLRIDGNFAEFPEMLSRVFYHFFYVKQAEAIAKSRNA